MKLRILSLLFFLLPVLSGQAQEDDLLHRFEQANESYQSGHFQEAIAHYEELTKHGESAALYFNLGNAYFKSDDVGRSILNYERALKMAPEDVDIHYNLKLANDRIKDNIEKLPQLNISRWWNTFTLATGVETWAWWAVGFMTTAMILVLVFLLSTIRGIRIVAFYTAILLLLISLFTWYQASQALQMVEAKTEAIILSPRVDVKGAPTNAGVNVFVIHEGTKVRVINERDGWINIQIASGNEGWIPQSDAENI